MTGGFFFHATNLSQNAVGYLECWLSVTFTILDSIGKKISRVVLNHCLISTVLVLIISTLSSKAPAFIKFIFN